MTEYTLQSNEVVILKEEDIISGAGSKRSDLILTNLSLLLVKKGFFGGAKGVVTFPLDQVKVHDHRAQAFLRRSSRGRAVLEVYFLNSQEWFRFRYGGKKKILDWAAAIDRLVTGAENPDPSGGELALPGAELVAGMLKDTLSVFRSRLRPQNELPATTSGKCTACGAPISGRRASTISCPCCGTAQQL